MVTIERARPRDFLAVAALDRQSWGDNRNSRYIPDGEHAWRLWVEYALVFCAREGDSLVGAVLAFPCLEPSLYCLHKVFVDGRSRGEGIGSRLFESVFEALDQQASDCFLTVDPENASASRLYEKWGFTERRFVKGFYREEEDRLVLTRRGAGEQG